MTLRKHIRCALLGLLALAPIAASLPAPPAWALEEAYQRDRLAQEQRLAPVTTEEELIFDLKNAVILPSENGPILYFTMTVENNSGRQKSFLDYWIRIKSSAGTEFKAELLPQDKLKKELPAGQRMDFSFYAPINDAVELSDLIFTIIRWNYSSRSLESRVGDIRFPDDAATVLRGAGGSQTLSFGSFQVDAEVTRLNIQPKETYVTPKLTLKLTNKGQSSLKLPGLQFALRTPGGAQYPLEPAAVADKVLLTPGVPVDLQLKGAMIPSSAASGQEVWDVIISQTVTLNSDQKLNYPIAALKVPLSAPNATPPGYTAEYTNADGTYRLQADKLSRMPWDDQDVLAADLSLTHGEANAMPFPELKAYFMLDEGAKVEAKIIRTDRAVGLPAGTAVHTMLAAKIPYLYPFDSVKLVVQEKTGDQSSQDMAQFELPLGSATLPSVALGGRQPISGAGRKASFAPRAVHTYIDDNSKLFEVQLESRNEEKRSAAVPKLTAFVKTPDDQLFPTKLREVKQRLNPSGKALQSFTAKLPMDMDTSGLKLVIGESTTDQHWTGPDEKPDGFLNAVEMALPAEATEVKPSLKNVAFFPYQISLGHVQTWLDRKELRVLFRYKLEKDSYFETNTDGTKLVIEFEDIKGNVKLSQSFFLETAPSTDDKKLELGEHDTKLTWADPDLVFLVEQLKQYKLSVYSELQGKRKLLASQKVDWFTILD
ncbi:hypothetical protein O9H85_26640 [Paenibacillus filicis]|uniref:Uncharacterized protein n=1 Tax=Paenibacillus gyeongsangnamensis TaxID=3388067 RepID=A0ABT4QGD1_9BACL|nr:hypothetical protein [Paenibacillus filicis]MCZ8515912.1 hypothetical protein [Paenibacillus filicis]